MRTRTSYRFNPSTGKIGPAQLAVPVAVGSIMILGAACSGSGGDPGIEAESPIADATVTASTVAVDSENQVTIDSEGNVAVDGDGQVTIDADGQVIVDPTG